MSPGFLRVIVVVVTALSLLAGPMVSQAGANSPAFIGTALLPSGDGHWMVTAKGQVSRSGSASFYGDMRSTRLNKPVVGMASTSSGKGYWLVASDGGVFSFGDARFHGSTGSLRLNKPVVGMAATSTGKGYWMVASDGGIFSFGDARFHGSTGSLRLNKPVVGMASTSTGKGYWMVASDGGIFSFGDARFHGSTGSIRLNQPVAGMTATETGDGYWLVGRDGGVFAFGSARFLGSGINGGTERAIAILRNDAGGYSMVRANGSVMRTEPAMEDLPALPTGPQLPSPTTTAPPTSAPPATTTTTTAPPAAPLQPAGPGGNWRLSFSDEFSASSLNTSKWTDCYWWALNGCTNEGNNELEWYMPGNVSVGDGKLHMTAKRQVILGTTGKTYQYTSGMVTSGRDMSTYGGPSRHEFTYGYVEARVKVPKGKGLWPAVWLLPVDNSWPPEIDIMEYLGHEPNKVHMTHHWRENGQHRQSGSSFSGPDFSQGYHTFGVNWQADAITWYVDGVERKRFTNTSAIPNQPMYVLLNLAVGGNWPGSPDANTQFPSTFSADWVRIWQPA